MHGGVPSSDVDPAAACTGRSEDYFFFVIAPLGFEKPLEKDSVFLQKSTKTFICVAPDWKEKNSAWKVIRKNNPTLAHL